MTYTKEQIIRAIEKIAGSGGVESLKRKFVSLIKSKAPEDAIEQARVKLYKRQAAGFKRSVK